MLAVALLPLLAGISRACPEGFLQASRDVCHSNITSMTWEEGRSECARRGGPFAVLVPSRFPSGRVGPEISLPLWALPKDLGMEAESVDECNVSPGCISILVSCYEVLSVKSANGTTCYERISNDVKLKDCYFRKHGECISSDLSPSEEFDCLKHKETNFQPSLNITFTDNTVTLSISNHYLLDDCWCVLAELDSASESEAFKANVFYFIPGRSPIRIFFPQSKGDFTKGAFWCQCFDYWTGLMLKTDVYSYGMCPPSSLACFLASVAPDDMRRWCLHNHVCSRMTTTTETPNDPQVDIWTVVEKLNTATKQVNMRHSDVSVILRKFQAVLNSEPLKTGSNVSYDGDSISVLVLPSSIGVKADESELSLVSSGVTIEDLADNNNVTAAVLLPKPQRVAFVVYKNRDSFHDGVFQPNSPVVEVFADVPYVDVVLRPISREPNRRCAFWDLQSLQWNTSGCSLTMQDQVNDVCRCTHLTTFAQIVFDAGALTPEDEMALEYISVVGCAASLLGALGTVVVSALCPEWRRRKSTLMLLNLTAAVALRDALFLAAAHGGSASRSVCVGVGVALHYAELAAGAWCVVAGVLQIFRFTTLTRGSVGVTHLVLRCVLVAWPAAALPVATLLGVQGLQAYAPGDSFAPGLCFPRGAELLWAVTLPLGLATLTNAGVFLFLVWVLCGFSADSRLKAARHGGPGLRTKALKCVMLCFLLGLPWVFGVPADSRVLPYLFCITATPQGLVLFLFFVISNEDLRSTFSLTLRRKVPGFFESNSSQTESSIIGYKH